MLYIILFLHQTTTRSHQESYHYLLYIILFLHQTTTFVIYTLLYICCISYYSYIKPQLRETNAANARCCISYYSYIKPQPVRARGKQPRVVYHTIPTSNHNKRMLGMKLLLLYIILFLHQTTTLTEFGLVGDVLYIILFLHQTTTLLHFSIMLLRCISYYSYIKPQLDMQNNWMNVVVYHTIPTSNHN